MMGSKLRMTNPIFMSSNTMLHTDKIPYIGGKSGGECDRMNTMKRLMRSNQAINTKWTPGEIRHVGLEEVASEEECHTTRRSKGVEDQTMNEMNR